MLFDENSKPMACKCGKPGAVEQQFCPWHQEVDDEDIPCNCCPECFNECIMDV